MGLVAEVGSAGLVLAESCVDSLFQAEVAILRVHSLFIMPLFFLHILAHRHGAAKVSSLCININLRIAEGP
jgi:hypothetical protein